MKDWILPDNRYTLDTVAAGHYGFVYCITNLESGRAYIGQRTFWEQIVRPPLKGQKKKRRSVRENEWRDYWSSSSTLKADVALLGEDALSREIIYICETKAEMCYRETQTIFALDCLLKPQQFYNKFVQCKIVASSVAHLAEK